MRVPLSPAGALGIVWHEALEVFAWLHGLLPYAHVV